MFARLIKRLGTTDIGRAYTYVLTGNISTLSKAEGKGQNVENQNVESPKRTSKVQNSIKDQNVESQMRLSTF
jgi:hypothetical protein